MLDSLSRRWGLSGERDLPSHYLGARLKRDRLSDLESGTLAELAYEDLADEASSPECSSSLTITITRDDPRAPIGIELDMVARQLHAAVEVIVGAVAPGSPTAGALRVGDSIRFVNGQPCCTIEDVKRALNYSHSLVNTFEIRRPRQAAIHQSAVLVLTADGAWLQATLALKSSRALELAEDGCEPEELTIRAATSLVILPNRELELRFGAPSDGYDVRMRLPSAAELERWYTLLTQMMMFRPGVRTEVTGWLVRADAQDSPVDWQYFELFTSNQVLVFASPHRNKLGQALYAVNLAECAVQRDPREPGVYLIRDMNREGALWRCSSCQVTRRDETVEGVLARHGMRRLSQ